MNEEIIYSLPHGAKVLLQLSGGKDSVACMILLKRHNIDFEAIHFTHEYGYSLPTEMAKETSNSLGVKLHIFDITNELNTLFLDNFYERPCRYCKSIMDRITVEFASKNSFSFICVGDNKDDKMLLNRISSLEGKINPISHYFNPRISLARELSILRPLIFSESKDILAYVLSTFPDFKRVHDTGDKYFEYSREGCPLQFKDLGAEYTKKMMLDLKRLNSWCSEFASSKGIRASIHLPSEFILTIPHGYENDCRKYLIEHGAVLNGYKPKKNLPYRYLLDVNLYSYLQQDRIISIAIERFQERLQIDGELVSYGNYTILSNPTISIYFISVDKNRLLISISSNNPKWSIDYLNNICLEIFHTMDFRVVNYSFDQ